MELFIMENLICVGTEEWLHVYSGYKENIDLFEHQKEIDLDPNDDYDGKEEDC